MVSVDVKHPVYLLTYPRKKKAWVDVGAHEGVGSKTGDAALTRSMPLPQNDRQVKTPTDVPHLGPREDVLPVRLTKKKEVVVVVVTRF